MNPVSADPDSHRAVRTPLTPLRKMLLMGVVFGLIPAAQRCLGISAHAVTWIMRRLDAAAFSLAGQIAKTDN
jgi:hypothetical protein